MRHLKGKKTKKYPSSNMPINGIGSSKIEFFINF
ncbi:hypothetical protein O163_03850 [Caldanaerobacter subterraneus subsp. yonseiensis KB-1]|uniref:Uncharacterized protein n=1 Tax=Caldanaerobacter subterraneus subsp. yonseiensis KB-1 TaxID=1388761 RepID=U5CRQ7_CALSX|nr:hypothetical protein O163_13670 [Caldanaerobacter subterraneus subsp. yonseiensis KB-1]ERM92653.1 hypothetical protein O163_03850 [Caldanaerobacter subterraneus subsp. yonseiensis KB-1]